jgi:hypothetical protein
MSNTETHIGKLRRVDLSGQTLEQWAETECKKLGVTKLSSYNKTWIEQFIDKSNNYEKYFVVKKELWETFDHKEIEDDIDEFTLQPDGTIHFVAQFYNGGTCLSEIVGEGIKRVLKL